MDFDEEFSLEHLIFQSRKCRSCGKMKDLVSDYYKTRRSSGPSAYSYECKECTIIRVVASRMTNEVLDRWEYPDW